MRIIAGEFRGRKLLGPLSDTTRPITDRVKQSLFDILAPMMARAVVYDCFAGTGSMGLESLSRGAAEAVFFERDRTAVARLKRNIDTLGMNVRARIVSRDIFQWFASAEACPSEAGHADVIFLDPPYRFLTAQADDLRLLGSRLAACHLAPGGVVVFRHDARDDLELPDLVRYDQRDYGGMTLEFLRLAQ